MTIYSGKEDLSKGYRNPERKLEVNTKFLDIIIIIKQQHNSKKLFKAHNNAWHFSPPKLKLSFLQKMHGCTAIFFLDFISPCYKSCKIFFPCRVINCDLSRENHTNGYPFERQNARLLNGWQTGGLAIWNGYHEWLNGWVKNLNGWSWTAERQKKNFERLVLNGWTAEEKFRTAHGEGVNGIRKISNGLRWTDKRQKRNFEWLAVKLKRSEKDWRPEFSDSKHPNQNAFFASFILADSKSQNPPTLFTI